MRCPKPKPPPAATPVSAADGPVESPALLSAPVAPPVADSMVPGHALPSTAAPLVGDGSADVTSIFGDTNHESNSMDGDSDNPSDMAVEDDTDDMELDGVQSTGASWLAGPPMAHASPANTLVSSANGAHFTFANAFGQSSASASAPSSLQQQQQQPQPPLQQPQPPPPPPSVLESPTSSGSDTSAATVITLPDNPAVPPAIAAVDEFATAPFEPFGEPLPIPGSNCDFAGLVVSWALLANHRHRPRLSADLSPELLMGSLYDLLLSKSRGASYKELDGNGCDMQGINWASMHVSRRAARRMRLAMYKNYTNVPHSALVEQHIPPLPRADSFFRFHKFMMRPRTKLSHFQLRSLLACPTRTQAFYPVFNGIQRLDTQTETASLALNLRGSPDVCVTTLDAKYGLLVAGTFGGDYFLRRIDSDHARPSTGTVSDASAQSSITNHLQLFQPRRSGPAVAFSSNDSVFRIMDVATQKMLFSRSYAVPMNCSAMSPDQRLRVMVGDQKEAIIVNADTGEIFQSLKGHHDYGFSCDWSQDGWTVATGFQDKTVKIWDARKWGAPVHTIRSEMAGVRALRFSPLGSGSRVLVAGEEADFVNIIEARNFASKQTFDLFGEIGGVAFSNEGNDLSVLVCDRLRGGLVRFEHAGIGFDWRRDNYTDRCHVAMGKYQRWMPAVALRQPLEDTWSAYSAWDEGAGVNLHRRAAVMDDMEPF